MEDINTNGVDTIMDKKLLRTLLETQLSELEMLQSMFYNPGEIHLDDYSIIADISDYIKEKSKFIPPCLDFSINLSIENINFELCATLPHDYPDVEPDIFVRSNKQNREQQRKLNTDLSAYVKSLERGDVCIYSAVTWLQDNAAAYINAENETVQVKNTVNSNEFARYWIYSHHIYSKTKRREILNLADDYHLTGFCLPGKPGIICIEGYTSDCNSWWSFIRAMTWKRIVCKFIENDTGNNVELFRKFKKFEELSFHCEGNRSNHMSMGELLKFLENHNSGYIFKELFGLDGKSSC